MLGVFAKVPQHQPVKTRLRLLLTPEETQRFYVASLADTLETAVRVAEPLVLFVPPPTRDGTVDDASRYTCDTLRPLLLDAGLSPEIWSRLESRWQIGRDLGARIEHALQELCHEGREPGLLIGSDSPTLQAVKLERGLEVLRSAESASGRPDVVLGPAADGGYYTIGTTRPVPELLRAIPWSTHRVLHDTRRRCDESGVRVTLLEPWTDVDRPEDLPRLTSRIAALRKSGDRSTASHTESALLALGLVDPSLRWHGRPRKRT